MSKKAFNPVGLMTTDLHLSDKGEDQHRFDLFKWIISNYSKKISFLFILGDLTDRKNFHSDRLVHRISNSIQTLADHFHVLLLRGNHDYDADPTTPFFGFLGKIPGVTYFSSPTVWKDEDLGTNWRVLFLPHTRNPGEGWNLASRKNLDAICLHQTFRGSVSESGYELGGIGTTPFRRFTCPIFSGDVHNPQKVGPITYVGSPYHVHYGDQFTPRVLLVDRKFEFVEINPPTIKMFVFDILRAEDLRRYEDRISSGDRAKIRLHLPTRRIASWPEQRDEIKRIAGEIGLEASSVILKEKKSDKQGRVHSVSRHKSHHEIFHEYSDHHQIGADLKAAGETLLED